MCFTMSGLNFWTTLRYFFLGGGPSLWRFEHFAKPKPPKKHGFLMWTFLKPCVLRCLTLKNIKKTMSFWHWPLSLWCFEQKASPDPPKVSQGIPQLPQASPKPSQRFPQKNIKKPNFFEGFQIHPHVTWTLAASFWVGTDPVYRARAKMTVVTNSLKRALLLGVERT